MKTCAAFTMARNESLWLRGWLSYYSNELEEENCYVLCEKNDQTIDEAQAIFKNVNFVVTPSPKPGTQSAGYYDGSLELWRLDCVRNWQTELLKKYSCVIFGDTDEILIPYQGINEYCQEVFIPSGQDHIRSECWQPVQQSDEPAVERVSGSLILKNRSKMWRLPNYDKTLLVRTPQTYSKGFHLTYGYDGTGKVLASNGMKIRHEEHVDSTLPMLHMWRCDLDDWFQDATWRYNATIEEAKEYFKTHQARWVDSNGAHATGDSELIPEAWKQKLIWR